MERGTQTTLHKYHTLNARAISTGGHRCPTAHSAPQAAHLEQKDGLLGLPPYLKQNTCPPKFDEELSTLVLGEERGQVPAAREQLLRGRRRGGPR
jgi:hypothetical protein